MPISEPGGTGGGGGLALGPPTNTFNGADRAAAEADRDTYAGAQAAWLAFYAAQPSFVIILTYGATTVYQGRRGAAWADVTPVITGPAGLLGPQARFLVYAYQNAAANTCRRSSRWDVCSKHRSFDSASGLDGSPSGSRCRRDYLPGRGSRQPGNRSRPGRLDLERSCRSPARCRCPGLLLCNGRRRVRYAGRRLSSRLTAVGQQLVRVCDGCWHKSNGSHNRPSRSGVRAGIRTSGASGRRSRTARRRNRSE